MNRISLWNFVWLRSAVLLILCTLTLNLHANSEDVTTSFDSQSLSKRDLSYQHNYFNDLLRQRVFGNSVPQCPCVIKPGTQKCITYDSRFQAASIEEAILAFPDVSSDPRKLEEAIGGPLNAAAFACRTLECQTCAALLVSRLVSVGLLRSPSDVSIPMPPHVNPRYCRRFRFANPPPSYTPPSVVPSFMKKLIDEGHRYATSGSGRSNDRNPTHVNHNAQRENELLKQQQQQQRQQLLGQQKQQRLQHEVRQRLQSNLYRQPQYQQPQYIKTYQQPASYYQATSQTLQSVQNPEPSDSYRPYKRSKRDFNDEILGNRFVIACINRGEVESEESDLLNLCSVCWTWRQLPEDYFPRLVNELLCKKDGDTTCLSSWGSCHQRFRNVDVLRKVGGKWETTTISIANCCDCKVKAGSEAHALVIGKY